MIGCMVFVVLGRAVAYHGDLWGVLLYFVVCERYFTIMFQEIKLQ
jgi:hypothetical protein